MPPRGRLRVKTPQHLLWPLKKKTRMNCSTCGKIGETADFHVKNTDKSNVIQYRSKRCRACENSNGRVLRALRKRHKLPPFGRPCDLCGRVERLCIDHCHVSGQFRGFICAGTCNIGLGMLQDSEAGLQLALEYLQRANASDF